MIRIFPSPQHAQPLEILPLDLDILLRVFAARAADLDRKSTRLNSSHRCISYAVFCLKKNGQDDVGLTGLGVTQYHGIKEYLAGSNISACYSSDLTRCLIVFFFNCSHPPREPLFPPQPPVLN